MNYVSKCIPVFLDIAKFADFWFKNLDVSRNQGVCYVIHIFLTSYLGKLKVPIFIIVGYVWQIFWRG